MASAIRRFLSYFTGGSTIIRFTFPFLVVMASGQLLAQKSKGWNFFPTVGINGRPPSIITRTGLPGPALFPQFSAGKNVGGVGLSLGIQIEKGRFGFEYYPTLRYTEWYRTYRNLENKNYKFMFDQNFQIYFSQKIDLGIGYSIVNHNQTYPITKYDGSTIYRSIEFSSYNILVSVPISLIHVEAKMQYVPRGHYPDSNMDDTHVLFNFRAFYRFEFLNRSKVGYYRTKSF